MPTRRVLDLQFPMGGLNRRQAYQKQPPFTTHDASNVRPDGTLEGRARGGSRPGIVKAFSDAVDGGGNVINLLSVVRTLSSDQLSQVTEDFTDALVPPWDTVPDTTVAADGLVVQTAGVGRIAVNTEKGIIAATTVNVNAAQSISVEMSSIPEPADTEYIIVDLYGGLDNANPPTKWVRWRTELWHDVASSPAQPYRMEISVSTLDSGSVNGTVTLVSPTWFTDVTLVMKVTPPGGVRYQVRYDGTRYDPPEIDVGSDIDPATFPLMAVVVDTNNTTAVVDIDNVIHTYVDPTAAKPPDMVVAISNKTLWAELDEGSISLCDESGLPSTDVIDFTENTTDILTAADHLGTLYICDYSDNRVKAIDNSGDITDGVLDDSGGQDWSALGIDVDNDIVVVSSGTLGAGEFSGSTGGTYTISSLSATLGLTLSIVDTGVALTTGDDLTLCNYRVTRAMKQYDSTTGAKGVKDIWKSTTMPAGMRIMEAWNERAVLSGDPDNPSTVQFSRRGDWTDLRAFQSNTDSERPMALGPGSTDGAGIGLPVTALAAAGEDYLFISAASELFMLRGDPGVQGVLSNISRIHGIGSATSWCRTPDGLIVFLSHDGIYAVHYNNPIPVSVSREALPVLLINVVNDSNQVVTLEYDSKFQGIHIYVTPKGPTTFGRQVWWFDWRTKSFWPQGFTNSNHDAFALTRVSKDSGMLVGCRDGYIRSYSAASATDDGSAISSSLLIGPIRLGSSDYKRGGLSELIVTLARFSGDVTILIDSGDDPEHALSTPTFSGNFTFSAGRNYTCRPRAGGNTVYLRLVNGDATPWVLETLTGVFDTWGQMRKL